MPPPMQSIGDGEPITPQTATAAAMQGATDEVSLRRLWAMRDQVDRMMRFSDQKGQYYDEWGQAFVALDHAIEEGLTRMTTGQRSRGALAESAATPLVGPPPQVRRAIAAAPQPPPAAPQQPMPTTPVQAETPEIIPQGRGILPASYEYPPGRTSTMGMAPSDFIQSAFGPLAISRPLNQISEAPSATTGPSRFAANMLRLLSAGGKQQAPQTPSPGEQAPGIPFGGFPPTLTRPSTPGIPMSSPDYGIASENREGYMATGPIPQSGPVIDWLRQLFGSR